MEGNIGDWKWKKNDKGGFDYDLIKSEKSKLPKYQEKPRVNAIYGLEDIQKKEMNKLIQSFNKDVEKFLNAIITKRNK